jgi:GT2 family glycosyltransferase
MVVVDNGSTDASVDSLPPNTCDVLLRNGINVGYSVAASQGLAVATAPWLLLINPDVVVDSEFLSAMLSAAGEVSRDVCTLVPDMRYQSNPSLVNSRGLTVDRIGVPAELDAGTSADDEDLQAVEVFAGSSGCCLLRADCLRVVGGLEPGYFAYFEDVDLACRFQRGGFKARIVPGAIAFHEGSASTREGSPLKTFLVARNRRITFRLNGPRTVRARIARVPVEVGHAVYSLSGGSMAALSGRFDALRLRRYTTFVRRSRALVDVASMEPPFSRRRGLLETLRRKRSVVGNIRRTDAERPRG